MKNRSGDRTTHSHIANLFQICSLRIQLAESLLALAARIGTVSFFQRNILADSLDGCIFTGYPLKLGQRWLGVKN